MTEAISVFSGAWLSTQVAKTACGSTAGTTLAGGEPLIRSLGHAGWRLGEHALGETSCKEAAFVSSVPSLLMSCQRGSLPLSAGIPSRPPSKAGVHLDLSVVSAARLPLQRRIALDAEDFETFIAFFLLHIIQILIRFLRYCADCRLMRKFRVCQIFSCR